MLRQDGEDLDHMPAALLMRIKTMLPQGELPLENVKQCLGVEARIIDGSAQVITCNGRDRRNGWNGCDVCNEMWRYVPSRRAALTARRRTCSRRVGVTVRNRL